MSLEEFKDWLELNNKHFNSTKGLRIIKKSLITIFKRVTEDSSVPSIDRITLGSGFPTDNTLCLDKKEYTIESPAWGLLSILKQAESHEELANKIIEFIDRNYDSDILQNDIETDKKQHIKSNCTKCGKEIGHLGICQKCFDKLHK